MTYFKQQLTSLVFRYLLRRLEDGPAPEPNNINIESWKEKEVMGFIFFFTVAFLLFLAPAGPIS